MVINLCIGLAGSGPKSGRPGPLKVAHEITGDQPSHAVRHHVHAPGRHIADCRAAKGVIIAAFRVPWITGLSNDFC